MPPLYFLKPLLLTLSTITTLNLAKADLTACGVICMGNMLQKGGDLNCTDPNTSQNISCLCSVQNFHNGINDCLSGACGSTDMSGSSIAAAWVTNICKSAGVGIIGSTSGSPVLITVLPTTSDTSPVFITVLPTATASSK